MYIILLVYIEATLYWLLFYNHFYMHSTYIFFSGSNARDEDDTKSDKELPHTLTVLVSSSDEDVPKESSHAQSKLSATGVVQPNNVVAVFFLWNWIGQCTEPSFVADQQTLGNPLEIVFTMLLR